MTEELALEGTARDVVRYLQNVRKELGFEVSDRIVVQLRGRRARRRRARRARRVDRARGARRAVLAERRRRAPLRRRRRRDRVRGRARVSGAAARRRLRLRRAADRDRDPLDGRRAARRRGATAASGLPELRERLLGGSGEHTRADRRLGRPARDAPRPAPARRSTTGYLAVLAEHGTEPMPGAHALVSALAGGCRSRSPRTRRGDRARDARDGGLPAVFDLVFSPAQGRRAEAGARRLPRRCEALGVAPAEAVAFEDSPPGAAAARAAGCS